MKPTRNSRLVPVNGTRLFVDERGDPEAPPLLYVHGGPGQSCWDFMAAQGDRLAERLRIIGVDQRGLLRSDDLPQGTPLDVDILVDDFEALRVELGLDAWSVLGHSAGGGYALRYVTRHRDSVTAALFDCPCWDCDLTDRYRLPVAARLLETAGRTQEAAACRRLAERPGRITAADASWETVQALGSAYLDLFFHRPGARREYEALMASSGFSDEQWARGSCHAPLLTAMYEPLLGLLPDIAVPSVLLHGRHDLVVPSEVIAEYRHGTLDARVHTFEESGHFAYHEEPDRYSHVVAEFVTQHTG